MSLNNIVAHYFILKIRKHVQKSGLNFDKNLAIFSVFKINVIQNAIKTQISAKKSKTNKEENRDE